ncbi:DUF6799 domain-containing protein [Reichenbachiella sp.]|uniref:DUF6799 domain-containing protein n=1 Tax=Reichenbachiella sp. TaxID=2184521 RepID=UPI003296F0A1
MKKMVLVIIGLFLGIGLLMAQGQRQDRKRIHQQDHILFQDGKMMQMKAGVATEMQSSYTFQNGTIVNPDGSYQLKNGKTKMLKEGECISNNGVRFRSQQKMMNKSQSGMGRGKMNKRNRQTPAGQPGNQDGNN